MACGRPIHPPLAAHFADHKKIVILSEAKDLLFPGSHRKFASLLFDLSHYAKLKLSHYPLCKWRVGPGRNRVAVDRAKKSAIRYFSHRTEASSRITGPPKQSLDAAPPRVKPVAAARATRLLLDPFEVAPYDEFLHRRVMGVLHGNGIDDKPMGVGHGDDLTG